MRRRELLQRIAARARQDGHRLELVRQGRAHELWRVNETMVTIPRHREIRELTALSIMRALENEMGDDWWRR